MKELFIPYEQALEIKNIGFGKRCIAWYDDQGLLCSDLNFGYRQKDMETGECVAPLYSQVFAWFRENYDFHHYIEPINMDGKVRYEYCVVNSSDDNKEFNEDVAYEYEDAEIECLKQLINLIKNK